jgi:threonine dehydrogenase-like Zn-dependent dehydrogenase
MAGRFMSSVAKPQKIRAAVQTAPNRIEMREFARPRIGPDEAILKVEACGICGTDVELYSGRLAIVQYPFIPGHEPLGIIDEIGERAASRWGISVGDRVAVEPLIACGACEACLAGSRTTCAKNMNYGFTSISLEPGIWGAYADFMYLHPRTVLHRISHNLPPEIAVMYNPLGAGVRWATSAPATKLGDAVVILGSGQRGLACVIAAKAAGAAPIIVTDLARATHKLEVAREFGADHTIIADRENAVAAIARLTKGQLADVVVDVTGAVQTVTDAIEMVRPGGTIVLAGVKGYREVPGFVSDKLVLRSITVRGVFTVDSASYRRAIRLIESGAAPFARMQSATFPLSEAEAAVHRLAGLDGKPPAIHVAIKPGS